MTVKIRKGRFLIYLWCPTVFLGLAVKKWAKHAPKQDLGCDLRVEADNKQQLKEIVKAMKSAKKHFRKLEVINVCSADGTRVVITL